MYRLLPLPQFILSVNFRAFGFPASRDLLFGSNLLTMSVTDDGYPRDASCARLIIWLSNLLTMSVTDDGYPRDASCARLIIWLQSVDHERH